MHSLESNLHVAVIYLRVSTEDQKTRGYSLPEQREACVKKANDLLAAVRRQQPGAQLQIVEFEDAISGDFLERPAMDQVREYVRDRRPRWFICLDPDRFSRKLVNSLLVTEEIEKAGTTLVFVQHDYQNTPEGQLFYQMRGSIAQYEKAKILERTARGRRGKLRRGKVATHTLIYGYAYDKERDEYLPFEDEARWVRQMYAWTAEGLRPAEIVDRLNAMGIPSKRGTRWYSSTVRQILSNTSYIGQMRCNRYDWGGMTTLMQLPKEKRTQSIRGRLRPQEEWITIPIPPLIDESLFRQVQTRVKTRKSQAKRGTMPLSGLMKCGLCGGSIHYILHRDSSYMLRCINKYPKSRESRREREVCSLPYLSSHIAERKVWEEVRTWIRDPYALLAYLQEAGSQAVPEISAADIRTQIEALGVQLVALRREQAETVRMVAKGTLDRQVADELMSEQKEKLDATSNALSEAEWRLAQIEAAKTHAQEIIDQLQKERELLEQEFGTTDAALDSMIDSERQQLLRGFIREVTISPGRQIVVHPLRPAREV